MHRFLYRSRGTHYLYLDHANNLSVTFQPFEENKFKDGTTICKVGNKMGISADKYTALFRSWSIPTTPIYSYVAIEIDINATFGRDEMRFDIFFFDT